MGNYLFSFFLCTLCCTLVSLLFPEKHSQGISKSLRLLLSAFLLVLFLSPIPKLFKNLSEWNAFDFTMLDTSFCTEEAQKSLEQTSKTYLAKLLTTRLEEVLGVAAGEVRVRILWEEDSAKLVTVILSGKAIWKDPSIIKEEVRNTLGCDCEVALE